MRGIEVVFQLEEGEILGEPLPARDNRRAVLAYEATEGGAGVLSRLVEDPQALGKVAREALILMHFENVDEAIAAGDAKLLQSRRGGLRPRLLSLPALLLQSARSRTDRPNER